MRPVIYPKEAATGVQDPIVSVIIPVHNTFRYLPQCLNSVLYQTLRNIEVICIDDASSDESLEYLNYRSSLDKRLSVYHMDDNAGAGVARNIGIEHASGKYYYFLDSDDYIEHDLLETATHTAEENASQIVVFKLRQVHATSMQTKFASWAFRTQYMPDTPTFSASDIAPHIFNTFQTWPHNKLFLASFIRNNNISYQELFRTNDLLFVYTALAHADRITPLDKFGINYRVGMTNNSQSTNHLHPTDFCKAFVALKERLASDGILETFYTSLQNAFLGGSIYNLKSQKTRSSFDILYSELRNHYFPIFKLDDMKDADIIFQDDYLIYKSIAANPDSSELYSSSAALRTAI